MDFRLQKASLAFISLRLEEGGVEKTLGIAAGFMTLRFDLFLA